MSKENKKELNENQLDNVSGGYIIHNPSPYGFDWQVIDDNTGYAVGRYNTKEEALKMAEKKLQSSKELTPEEILNIRKISAIDSADMAKEITKEVSNSYIVDEFLNK